MRKYPFKLPLGKYHALYTLQIAWPQVVRIEGTDDTSTVENDVFRAHRELAWRGNVSEYAVEYEIKRNQISAGELTELQTQSKLLDSYIQSSLRVNGGAVTEARGAGLSDRQAAAFKMLAYTGLLASDVKGDKAGASFDQLCEALQAVPIVENLYPRSAALIRNALYKRARAAAKDEEAMDKCGLVVGFRYGRFDAVLAQQAAAKLADDDTLVLQVIWMNAVRGNAASAQADARRFLAAHMKSGRLVPAHAAMLMAAMQRTGADIPQALRDYAGRSAVDVWPRPLLAFQLRMLSQEQLLEAVAQLPEGAHDLAMNEAWFHIGERAVSEGRTDAALQAFRWVRLHSPRDLMQYRLALAELDRLELEDPDYDKGVDAWNAKRYSDAGQHFRSAAARGVAAAEYMLGQQYQDGLGVPIDTKRAREFYLRAAEHGDLGAMNQLGIFYDEGIGTAKDLETAVHWFERAAQFGHVHASRNIGLRYLEGFGGVKVDRSKAIRYLNDAAELGNVEAQARLSQMYADGDAVSKDYTLALYWSLQAAERDNADATAILAFLFAYGHGVPEDIPHGLQLFRAAADKGSIAAQTQLGNHYRTGRGVEKDPREALRWFLKAANSNSFAREQAGYAYLYGEGTSVDFGKAVNMLSANRASDPGAVCYGLARAFDEERRSSVQWQNALAQIRARAEQGNAECQSKLGLAFQFGWGVPIDEAAAAVWYTKAADSGVPVALNNLADQYERGAGVAQDFARAVKLYRQAAKTGFGTAMYSLGLLFEEGKGVPTDPYLACTYFALAREYSQPNAAAAYERISKSVSKDVAHRATSFAAAWDPGKPLPDETNAE